MGGLHVLILACGYEQTSRIQISPPWDAALGADWDPGKAESFRKSFLERGYNFKGLYLNEFK